MGARGEPAGGGAVTCEACHKQEAEQFQRSVHPAAGANCISCHGGEPEYKVDSATVAFAEKVSALLAPGEAIVGANGLIRLVPIRILAASSVAHSNPYVHEERTAAARALDEAAALLQMVLGFLTPTQRQVIVLRYGLDGRAAAAVVFPRFEAGRREGGTCQTCKARM